jgi:hypothetical protein
MEWLAVVAVVEIPHLVLVVLEPQDRVMLVARVAQAQLDIVLAAAVALVLSVKLPQALLLLATAASVYRRQSMAQQPTMLAGVVAAVTAARQEQVVVAVAAMAL